MILLPYKSENFKAEMLILLPKEEHECKTEDWLSQISWNTIKSEMMNMKREFSSTNSPQYTSVNCFHEMFAPFVRLHDISTAGKIIALEMPAFELDSNYQLEKVLPSLGMPSAFTPGKANFSGISDRPVEIDQVIHQTKVGYTLINNPSTQPKF